MGKNDIYDAIKPAPEKKVKVKAPKAPKVKKEKVTKVKEPKAVKIKMPMNKDLLTIIIVVAVVFLATAGIVGYYFVGVKSEVIGTYDGGKVTRGEFETIYRFYASQFSYMGYPVDSIADYVVNNKIFIDKVLIKKATDAGYKLSDKDKTEIDSMFSNKENLDMLASMSIDAEILKQSYINDSIIAQYIENLKSKVTTEQVKTKIVADEGKNADLNLYETSHILFSFETDMTDAAKAELLTKAKGVLKQIQGGSDFATLAKQYSGDSQTAQVGGKFTMINNDSVMSEYRDEVLKLKAGQLSSNIVETDYGYHIIKLNSITKDGRLTGSTDITDYVDGIISDIEEAAHCKPNDKKIKTITDKINKELGLTSSDTSDDNK